MPDGSGGAKEYRITDHLASLRTTLNASGTVTSTYDYEPFGDPLTGSPARQGFNSRERDTESEEFNNGVRKLDEEAGRFTSIDPLWEEFPAWNPYQYAYNSPLGVTDPKGLQGEIVADDVGGGGGGGGGVPVPLPGLGSIPQVVEVGTRVAVLGEMFKRAYDLANSVDGGVVLVGASDNPVVVPGELYEYLDDGTTEAYAAAVTLLLAAQAAEGDDPGVPVYEAPGRNPAQDKALTDDEIEILKDAGYDIHGEKGGKRTGKIDIYKDSDGWLHLKPKGGAGSGEPLYININNL